MESASFDISESDEKARAAARAVAASRAPLRDEAVQAARWDGAFFTEMGRAGLLGGPLPEAYGGGGRGALTTALVHEGFGRGAEDMGLAIAWGAHTLRVGVPMARFGTDEQRRRVLPALARGDVVGALSSNPHEMEARREGDRWVLEGVSHGVVNGPVADVFLVATSTRGPDGACARTVFLVDRATRGLFASEPARTIGMSSALFGSLTCQGVTVGDDAVIGAPFGGDAGLALGRLWQRACLSAHWLGAMEAAFERALARVRSRVEPEIGRPLARSQAARTTLANMLVRCEALRRLSYRAAHAIDRDEGDADLHAALAALHIAMGAPIAAREAASLHGAEGAFSDHPIARAQRDAAMIDMAWESVDQLRSIIGGALVGLG